MSEPAKVEDGMASEKASDEAEVYVSDSVPEEDETSTRLPQKEDPTLLANGHSDEPLIQSLQEQLSKLKLELQAKDDELAAARTGPSENDVSAGSDPVSILELQAELAETQKERDDAKEQLGEFLSKISSMKTVFRNYKATQEELESTQSELELLKGVVAQLTQDKKALEDAEEVYAIRCKSAEAEKIKLAQTIEQLKTESTDLNAECDRLSLQLTTLRREFQSKDDSLLDEKYTLENEVSRLTKKLNEQKAQFSELTLAQEEISMENKSLALVIEELKERIESQDLQAETHKSNLEEVSKHWESKYNALEQDIKGKESEAASLSKQLDLLLKEKNEALAAVEEKSAELERLVEETSKIAPLQEELQSKQLIIGKLRHEAIILNEHLTKALAMLKQQLNSSNNTVDRELISNVILNFILIPRGDTKKFEALQLLSSLLEWDEQRKIQAGLLHGKSGGTDDGRALRLGFVSMWTDFLEKESSKK